MKHAFIFAFGFLLSFAVCAEGVSVSDVEVRQLWPWSGDIDIGFTITGGNTAVKFTAQYDGVEPFEIPERELSGDFFDAAPGRRHVRWNLKRAGLDGKTLFNLKITAQADATDRTYLILNLVDGSYRYAAAEPEGGWFSDPDNYRTKMVFRRIPAGTFTMGYSDALLDKLEFSGVKSDGKTYNYKTYNKAREMTLSSDYYMAVFKATVGQHLYVTSAVDGVAAKVSDKGAQYALGTYDEMRGKNDETDGIDWPHTKYDVASGSVIAAYRHAVRNTFPGDWVIDLPTSAQWVRAARADTPDDKVWDIRGEYFGDADPATTMDDLISYANQVGCWTENSEGLSDSVKKTLGRYAPNGWGFYDFNGAYFEWGIDYSGWYDTQTDPVGKTTGTKRCRCGAYKAATYICWMAPGYLQDYPSTESCGYRLCIHLKSLFKGK